MDIYNADFVSSYPRESLCPTDGIPEFAFIGRSNVGKSSLINMLTGKKGLAKVSGTPGKTQLINFFRINKRWYLVDLPGYGYAKVSKTKLKELSKMIEGYLMFRQTLALAFVLIDSNVPPQNADLEFINTLGAGNVPFALVFTKADRLTPGQLANSMAAFFEKLSETWETLPKHFVSSAEYRTGREEILGYIEEVMKSI
jgi:GTP-binding protein